MPVPGQILGGKYRLERLVGSGGFSSVWAARNVMLDRPVALKILAESFARLPGFLPRFLREAKLASRAIHKNIVAVEDIDQTPEGLVYLVMELLEGHTLADELKGGKTLSLERTLEIILPTLEGLAAAHECNIIHRDIKPANIFLTREGSGGPRVRILDLGLAKDLVSDDELTSTDQMVGTPSYLAPEMFLGPQTRNWAPTADVFACGMVMFRMLAGGLPFDRSVAGLPPLEQFLARGEFYQTVEQMPAPGEYVSGLPPAVDEVVRQAISIEVGARYPHAMAMYEDLLRAAARPSRPSSLPSSPPLGGSSTPYEQISYEPIVDLQNFGLSFEDDDEYDDGKTRVDANPWGLVHSSDPAEDFDFDEDNTSTIERHPPSAAAQPSHDEAPPSSSQWSPSTERADEPLDSEEDEEETMKRSPVPTPAPSPSSIEPPDTSPSAPSVPAEPATGAIPQPPPPPSPPPLQPAPGVAPVKKRSFAVVAGGVVALGLVVILAAGAIYLTTRPTEGTMGSVEPPRIITFEITSEPSGATVSVDEVVVGTTPYRVTLTATENPRRLVVRAVGYVPDERVLQFSESQHLEIELEPLATPELIPPADADVSETVLPSG